MESLAEHLKGIALVNLPAVETAEALRENLRRFGPVKLTTYRNFESALNFLLPLKSFVTRYLVLEIRDWSMVICDMNGESCFVNALAVSRMKSCIGIAGYFKETSRQFNFIRNGKEDRAVVCYWDGRWFFHQQGEPHSFESISDYHARRKQDRLKPDRVIEYIGRATGMSMPTSWRTAPFAEIYGIERSIQDVRVPIIRYKTEADI